jgi:hypothetical protein
VVEQTAGVATKHLDAALELGVCGFMSMPPNTTVERSCVCLA